MYLQEVYKLLICTNQHNIWEYEHFNFVSKILINASKQDEEQIVPTILTIGRNTCCKYVDD